MLYGVLTYLRRSDGKVLMVKKPPGERDPNSGLCTLPGGKLEPPEKGLNSLRGRLEAAVRETKQETGLRIFEPSVKGVILFDNEGRTFDRWKNPPDYLVHIVFSTKYSGNLLEKGDGGEIPFWVHEYDIPRLPKHDGDTLIYDWIRWHQEPFFGVIKQKGKGLNRDESFVDFF